MSTLSERSQGCIPIKFMIFFTASGGRWEHERGGGSEGEGGRWEHERGGRVERE